MAIQFLNTGYFPDNAKLTFGDAAAPDLEIFHDGSHSEISELGTGDLRLRGDSVWILESDGTNQISAYQGTAKLYKDGNEKLSTTSGGATITGAVTVSGGTENLLGNFVSTDSIAEIRVQDDTAYTRLLNVGSQFKIMPNDGSETLILDGSDDSATFAGKIIIADGTTYPQSTDKLYIGGGGLASADAAIYMGNQGAGGGYGYRIYYSGTGQGNNNKLIFKSENLGTEVDMLTFTADGNATFSGDITLGANHIGRDGDNYIGFETDDLIKFRVAGATQVKVSDGAFSPQTDSDIDLGSNGTRFANLWVDSINGGSVVSGSYLPLAGGTMTGNTLHGDSILSQWGAGNDVEINHDGNDSYITFRNTDVKIQQLGTDKDILFKADDGSGGTENYIQIDGSEGRTTFNKTIRLNDVAILQIGNAADLRLYHNGTNSNIENFAGNLQIIQNLDDGDITFRCDDGSGGTTTYFYLDGSQQRTNFENSIRLHDNVQAQFGNAGDLQIKHNGTNSSISNDIGNLYISNHADDKDIIFECDDGSGASTEYFRLDGSSVLNVFTKPARWEDGVQAQFGGGNDLRIQHDGTDSAIENNTGDLYITNKADDKDIIFQSDDGSGGYETYFYLDGSQKFITVMDSIQFTFGTSQDTRLYHDGSNAYFKNYTGNFNISAHTASGDMVFTQYGDDRDIIFQSDDGTGGVATYFYLDGSATNMKALKDIRFNSSTSVV